MSGGLYVYGVVDGRAPLGPISRRGVAEAEVCVLEDGPFGVVVSDVPPGDLVAQRADLLAHSEVLQEVVAATDVLPVRFGTVFTSQRELSTAFLEPNQEPLVRMLERVAGCVEIQVKAEYDQDAVAREIAGDRTIQKLQARARSRGNVESKIELGRRFAQVLEGMRYADGRRIVDSLASAARDVVTADGTGEYGIVAASFLVARGDVERMDADFEKLRSSLADRMSLRCVGPLPPYSFVDAAALVTG